MGDPQLFTDKDLEGQATLSGQVIVSYEGNIAIIQMLCGDNRLNIDFITKMHKALDEVERNDEAQVLITTSDGKFYSNGLDLNWLGEKLTREELRSAFMMHYVRGLFKRIATFPMPTIAALNGHAFAGGCMLALCHDYIVMSSTRGWMCLNEVHLGMLFTPFMRNIVQAKLPKGLPTHEAMVLGRRFTAHEALNSGIIQQICPGDKLMQTAKSFGASLVKRSPYNRESLQNMKADMYNSCFTTEPISKSKL